MLISNSDLNEVLSTAALLAHLSFFYATKFSLINFICQMHFNRVN